MDTSIQKFEDYESFFDFKEGKIADKKGVVLAEEFEKRRWFNDELTDYLHILHLTNGVFLLSKMKTTSRIGKDDWEHYSEEIGIISKVEPNNTVLQKYSYISYSFKNSFTPSYNEYFLKDINKIIFLDSIRPIVNNIIPSENTKNFDLSFERINNSDLQYYSLNIEQYCNIIHEGIEKVLTTLFSYHIVKEIVFQLNKENNKFIDKPSSSILNFQTNDKVPQLNFVSNFNILYSLPSSGIKILTLKLGTYYRLIIIPQNSFGLTPVDYKISETSMNSKLQLIICHKYKQYCKLIRDLSPELILQPVENEIINIKLNDE